MLKPLVKTAIGTFLFATLTFPCFGGETSSADTPPKSDSPATFLTPLTDRGITFPLSYTGEVMGNLSGGYKQGAVYDGLIQTGIQIDLEKLSGWKGASFLVNGLYPHGPSITNLYVHDFNGVSNINAYNSVRLYELWVQQNFDQDHYSFRIGQLAADSEFCISNGCCLFVNSAFGVIPLLSKNLNAPIYPMTAPGARFRFAPNDSWATQISAFIGDVGNQATNNQHGTSFFHNSTGALIMGETGYTFNPPPKTPETTGAKNQVPTERPLSGTYKLGGFCDTATFDQVNSSGPCRSEYAFYVIADQEVWHEQGDPEQGLRLFGRIGAAPANRSTVSFYFDSGVNYQGLLPKRDKDICGLGVSYTKLSTDLLDSNGQALESHHETILELSYQAVVNSWLTLQPDLQYVFNPGAVGHQQNAVVAGLRFTVNF